mgnify:CR=1 FL=1
MSNFKIKDVGLDTSNLEYSVSDSNFSYIHTSVNSNNGYIVKEFMSDIKYTLITSIDFLDMCDIAIEGHLSELGRDNIDLLLINSKCNFSEYHETINNLLNSGTVSQIGIKNPESVEQLQSILEVIDSIKYISLELCPLNFNYELINYCNENDISIIGFNPFGGHLTSGQIIDSFSVSYLMCFAANYCDSVFLSSRDLVFAEEERKYLMSLINTESSEKYTLNKSISKLNKPFPKSASVSLKVDDNLIIPIKDQTTLYNYDELLINLGNINVYIDNKDSESDDIDKLESSVWEYLNEIKMPDDTKNPDDIISICRPYVQKLANIIYPGIENWFLGTFCVNRNNMFVITAARETENKKLFKKPKKTKEVHNYILFYFDGNVIFRKLKFAEEMTLES